jgi:predicted HTH domain antitoxin
MNTITIRIPEQMPATLAIDIERDIKLYLAVKYYQKALITIGKAADLADMAKMDFELFLAHNDIPISLLDYSDIQADLHRIKAREVLTA